VKDYRLEGGSFVIFVNYKSTFIMNRFSSLFGNLLLNHLIRNRSEAYCQIPTGPNVPAPQLLTEMWKFLKEYPPTRPFQPLHYFANVLLGMVRNENVNMVA
jgi:hypothetical protein